MAGHYQNNDLTAVRLASIRSRVQRSVSFLGLLDSFRVTVSFLGLHDTARVQRSVSFLGLLIPLAFSGLFLFWVCLIAFA